VSSIPAWWVSSIPPQLDWWVSSIPEAGLVGVQHSSFVVGVQHSPPDWWVSSIPEAGLVGVQHSSRPAFLPKPDWWVSSIPAAFLESGEDGQYVVRLSDNHHRWDCPYPAVERLEDGTLVVITYGHWIEGEPAFIRSVHLRPERLARQFPINEESLDTHQIGNHWN
jgi:hypothetical protein